MRSPPVFSAGICSGRSDCGSDMANYPDVFIGPTFSDTAFATNATSGYTGIPTTGAGYGTGYTPRLDISEEYDVDKGLYGEPLFYAEEWW